MMVLNTTILALRLSRYGVNVIIFYDYSTLSNIITHIITIIQIILFLVNS